MQVRLPSVSTDFPVYTDPLESAGPLSVSTAPALATPALHVFTDSRSVYTDFLSSITSLSPRAVSTDPNFHLHRRGLARGPWQPLCGLNQCVRAFNFSTSLPFLGRSRSGFYSLTSSPPLPYPSFGFDFGGDVFRPPPPRSPISA